MTAINKTVETNRLGSSVARAFYIDGDRYRYDFKVCTPAKGWQQYDTDQDAWYYGVWVNVAERQIMTYAEGDETLVTSPTAEIFQAELDALSEFHGPPPPAFVVLDVDGSVTNVYDEKALFGRTVDGLFATGETDV